MRTHFDYNNDGGHYSYLNGVDVHTLLGAFTQLSYFIVECFCSVFHLRSKLLKEKFGPGEMSRCGKERRYIHVHNP